MFLNFPCGFSPGVEVCLFYRVRNFCYSLVPSKPPDKAEPEVLDSTSVRLHWSSIPERFHNGIIRGYRILYKRLGNGTNYQEKTTVPPARTLLLLNLDKATKYHGKVFAYTNAGDGKESNFTFKTADDSK